MILNQYAIIVPLDNMEVICPSHKNPVDNDKMVPFVCGRGDFHYLKSPTLAFVGYKSLRPYNQPTKLAVERA